MPTSEQQRAAAGGRIEVLEKMLALLASQEQRLSDYSIAFALPSGDRLYAKLGGSGTLVTVDKVDGILTASHVIGLLDKSKAVGLVLPSLPKQTVHRVELDMKLCRRFDLPPQGKWSRRPDLGLIVPPFDIISVLKSKKVFYNLSQRRMEILQRPPALSDGFWILTGCSQEWVGELPPEQGFKQVMVFKGMHGKGIITKAAVDKQNQFDYLGFGALYNELYSGPDRYGGISGGGLWQLLVRSDGDKLEITERLLSGVAFCQSKKRAGREGITRDIACHGRRSLYQVLIDRVRASAA